VYLISNGSAGDLDRYGHRDLRLEGMKVRRESTKNLLADALSEPGVAIPDASLSGNESPASVGDESPFIGRDVGRTPATSSLADLLADLERESLLVDELERPAVLDQIRVLRRLVRNDRAE